MLWQISFLLFLPAHRTRGSHPVSLLRPYQRGISQAKALFGRWFQREVTRAAVVGYRRRGMSHTRRHAKRDFLVNVAPHKPTEAGYQEQQHRNACPAQPLVWAVAPARIAACFARILGKAHPPIFVGFGPGRTVGREITSDPLLLVQPDYPGILPHHALVEHPARENFEVLLLQGYKVTVADFSNPGDGVQRDPPELPLLPQCIAEFPHPLHPSAGPASTFSTIKPAPFPGQKQTV